MRAQAAPTPPSPSARPPHFVQLKTNKTKGGVPKVTTWRQGRTFLPTFWVGKFPGCDISPNTHILPLHPVVYYILDKLVGYDVATAIIPINCYHTHINKWHPSGVVWLGPLLGTESGRCWLAAHGKFEMLLLTCCFPLDWLKLSSLNKAASCD